MRLLPPGAELYPADRVRDVPDGRRRSAADACRSLAQLAWALVLIRTATPDDWAGIFPFFSRIVADGRTYTYYPDNLSQEQAAELWMQPAPWRTVVAVHDDVIVGSALMGPNRPGRGGHVATASFMVDPRFRQHGAGRALGEHVLDWARDAGYHSMQFNAVVETNTSAVRLWRSLGFEIVGTVPEAFRHPDHGLVGLHVMYRRLSETGR